MSRFLNRAAAIAAGIAIALLVVLLVIIWSGVRSGVIAGGTRYRDNESATTLPQMYDEFEQNDVFRVSEVSEMPVSYSQKPDHFSVGTTESAATDNPTREVGTTERIENIKSAAGEKDDVLLKSKKDLEYVKPLKTYRNRYQDPYDGGEVKKHHSGHFRLPQDQIWDPHPEYEFEAFGNRFHLVLAHNAEFVYPEIKVTHVSENSSRREELGHRLRCLYSGHVEGDSRSVVSVDLCNGMTGRIHTSTGSYYIKPSENWHAEAAPLDNSLQHVIYHESATKTSSNNVNAPDDRSGDHNCGVIDYVTEDAPAPLMNEEGRRIYVGTHIRNRRSLTEKTSVDETQEDYNYHDVEDDDTGTQRFGYYESPEYQNFNRHFPAQRMDYPVQRYQEPEMDDPFATWRPRRALPQEYFVEIMVVADAKMADYHGDNLYSYILVLMSTVARIFKDPSIGNPISIALMKITTTDETFGSIYSESNGIAAAEMLKSFCLWQKHNNVLDEESPEHHDAALLLTRENLCHNPEKGRCETLGLAELGRMCVPRASCAIVQDNGLSAAFTIAHEIGHILNMPHDDDMKCREFRGNARMYNVMSRTLDDQTFPWEWSKCSRHYVTEFLDAGYVNCLLDEPITSMAPSTALWLPGQVYSDDKQCELVFGRGSKICPYMVGDHVCRLLWCTSDKDNYISTQGCHTQHMPWADGTACAPGKWCQRAECVSRKELKPIDGQWGPWESYGECSRTCGGGIKKKYRKCDNPFPQNGGNYCFGTRVKYRSCGTKDCPPDATDFREDQCSKFNNNSFNFRDLPRDVRWHAQYTRIHPEDRCKLYCQVENMHHYYMLRDKVIDGTPCGPDTFHICVNGQCKPAGCDHVLNSTAVLDTCGVCRGDNSTCQRITGSYNSSIYGYTMVAKIPAGSSYIDIRQLGWRESNNDSNYLALRNGENGEYILNGNFTVMHRKVIVQQKITIEYSGPESVVERLNSSRPIGIDIVLEVLSVGLVHPPQITYEYTVPKRILNSYTWVLSNWSSCNRVCHGASYRKAECRSTEYKDVVPDDYCRSEEKPREESQICNTHCKLQWQVISKSECSNHCGPGTRTVTSRCVQLLTTFSQPRPIAKHACMHLERPPDREVCIGPCDDAHWMYAEWGLCSVSCGGGLQIRTAACVDANGRPVPEIKCNSREKLLKRFCAQEACPKWALGEWTPCSVSCGIGKRERPFWCQVENRVISTQYCSNELPGSMEACDMGPCYDWHASTWSPCSTSCGEGISRREVICKSTAGSAENKCNSIDKPIDTRTCVEKPCPIQATSTPITYSSELEDGSTQQDNEVDSNGVLPDRLPFHSGYKWRTGTFGECSKSCNGGFKNRAVKCSSAETGVVAPEIYCDSQQKPHAVVLCNKNSCPLWNTGDWSECDSECGPGFQHRQVRCQSQRGEILPDKDCSPESKPDHVKRCSKSACIEERIPPRKAPPMDNHYGSNVRNRHNGHRWRMSSWTPCSKSCGYGTKKRRVDCVARIDAAEVTVDEQHCLSIRRRPRSQRPCQRIACDFTWQEGTWTKCSAECGDGIQHRSVSCHRVNRYGWIDPALSEGCKISERPSTDQKCKLRECNDEFYWTAGPWRKCTQPCGRKGKQVRRIFCHRRDGKKVAKSRCPAQFKPQRKRKCNQRRCKASSCLEAQKRFKTTKDGEYSLLIGGKDMSIYCHNMASDQPLEYLTLPAGDRENYAEVYDKRLLNPNTCPFDGQRNDDCDCATDAGTTSGRTMFKRVRLDPKTLFIIGDDYTFSWTKGAKRVEFGKAGDCYSFVHCPQGRFSINLSGTRLRLSPDLTWVSQGANASRDINKISDQRLVGKCGGYCGFCSPKTGLKLDVLPP